jgi:hypothetical protein
MLYTKFMKTLIMSTLTLLYHLTTFALTLETFNVGSGHWICRPMADEREPKVDRGD